VKKAFIIFLTTFFIVGYSPAQTVVNDALFPDVIGFNKRILRLNGVGIRNKYLMNVYVAGLYLQESSSDPEYIIDADKPMSIRIHIVSSLLTNETMVRYIRQGFYWSLNGNVKPIKDQIDMICEIFSAEPTHVGDVYAIHYIPGVGVVASKNGMLYDFSNWKDKTAMINYTYDGKAAIAGGIYYKKALFGIWLSDKPVDDDLKEAMLGIKQKNINYK
jgi:hypothetical protein